MTQNQIAYFKAVEEARHNQEMEREAQRANRANERLTKASQDITSSHYRASEQIDTAKVLETQRSNLVTEALKAKQIAADATLSYATAALRGEEKSLRARESELTEARTSAEQAQKLLTQAKITTESAQQAYLTGKTASEIARGELASQQTKLTQKETDWYEANSILKGLGDVVKMAGGLSLMK